MTEFERMYGHLAEEVNTIMLKSPGELRSRADRRTRLRLAGTAVAVAAVVGGIAVGGQWVLRAGDAPLPQPGTSQVVPTPTQPPSPTPSLPTPTPTPTTSPSPTQPPDVPVPTQIPDRAFLRLADTNGPEAPDARTDLPALPSLCGARYASDADIAVRRAMHVTYWATRQAPGTVPDGTFAQTITAYRTPAAAMRAMQDISRAVANCRTETRGSVTYRNRLLPGSYPDADEAFLIEVRYPTVDPEGNRVGGDDVRLVSAVRRGLVVMLLYERGWEAGWSAERSVQDAFTGKAIKRLKDWRG